MNRGISALVEIRLKRR